MKKSKTYRQLLESHKKVLQSLQYKSGLFAASSKSVDTGYDKAWLRDNFYECLPFLYLEDWKTVTHTYKTLLKIFEKHEEKIDWAIRQKPTYRHEYIHARFHPETFDEFWEEWGNKQHDSIGAILFMIGTLEDNKVKIIDSQRDKEIVQKLVNYLDSIEYWHDLDSGMWEEDEEIHASSVGACVAGLEAVKRHGIKVSQQLIDNGKKTLRKLLPRESKKKFVDLAQLSLIWPYKVTTKEETKKILDHVEYHLVKKMGVIRYKNDYYYNKNKDGYSEEAEWTFGLSWLAIIYEKLGNLDKADEYLRRSRDTITRDGLIPELYYSNSKKYNENTPLGWSEGLFIIALYNLHYKHLDTEIPN